MMRNNKGFSLVELVVALGIFAVLGVALVGFLMSGTNNYNRSNATVNLQYEQQLAVNQIRDLIIESSCGLNFDETDKVLTIYDTKIYEGGAEKFPVSFISLDNDKLYYSAKEFDALADIDIASTDKYLLAEYVNDFSVDLSKVSEKKVQFTITFVRDGINQVATETVALRNRVVSGNDASEIWGNPSTVVESFIDSIVISRAGVDFPYNGEDEIGKAGGYAEVSYSARVSSSNAFTTREYAVDWATIEVVGEGSPAVNKDYDGISITENGNEVTVRVEQTVENDTVFMLCATSVDDPSKYARLKITVKDGGIYPSSMVLEDKEIEVFDEETASTKLVEVEQGNGYNAYRIVPTLTYYNYATNTSEAVEGEYSKYTWEVYLSPVEGVVTPENPDGDTTDTALPEGCSFDATTGRLVVTDAVNGRTVYVKAIAKERAFDNSEISDVWETPINGIAPYDPDTTLRIAVGDNILSRGGNLPVELQVLNRPVDEEGTGATYDYHIQIEPYNEDSTQWDGSAANSDFDYVSLSDVTEYNQKTARHEADRQEEWKENTDFGLEELDPLYLSCSKTLNWSYPFKFVISATATRQRTAGEQAQDDDVLVAEPVIVTIPTVEVILRTVTGGLDASLGLDALPIIDDKVLRYEDWYFMNMDPKDPNIKETSTRRWFKVEFKNLELDDDDWATYELENNYLFLNQVGRPLNEKIVTYPETTIKKLEGLSGFKVKLKNWERLANRPVFLNFTVTVKDNNHNAQASKVQQYFIVYDLYSPAQEEDTAN